MSDWGAYLVLFAVGCIAGLLNVIAGGGSFLTLPVLIFLGLPATLANGTNRIAIFLQNVGAVWGFHRYKVLEWSSALWAAVPATLGAVLGTWAALVISDEAFQKILAFLMIAVTLWTLWDPLKKAPAGTAARSHPELLPPETSASKAAIEPNSVSPGYRSEASPSAAPSRVLLGLAFFLVGIYGGFVQAGVGFMILAVTTMAGLDLVRGNGVKVLSILVFTFVSLGIFAWEGEVNWPLGLVLAGGSVVGGLIGVRLTVLKGHAWVKAVVTTAVIVLAIKLWLTGS
ncbi:MAG: sulfite exporter TauE/SafE family protein [Acidobacteriota bacterium]